MSNCAQKTCNNRDRPARRYETKSASESFLARCVKVRVHMTACTCTWFRIRSVATVRLVHARVHARGHRAIHAARHRDFKKFMIKSRLRPMCSMYSSR